MAEWINRVPFSGRRFYAPKEKYSPGLWIKIAYRNRMGEVARIRNQPSSCKKVVMCGQIQNLVVSSKHPDAGVARKGTLLAAVANDQGHLRIAAV